VTERDWVSDFHALAARKARLIGVCGEFFDHRRSSDEERDWPLSWLRAIASTDDFLEQDWPWGLWFAFADSLVFHFEPLGSGEGFRLGLEESLPVVTSEPRLQDTCVEDLCKLPPSSPVAGTSLLAISVLAYAAGREGSVGWDQRSPSNPPVGIKLLFERGEVWLLNTADEMEVRGWPPPDWEYHATHFDLREWEHRA